MYVKKEMGEDHDMFSFFLGADNDDINEIKRHFTVIEFLKDLCKIISLSK